MTEPQNEHLVRLISERWDGIKLFCRTNGLELTEIVRVTCEMGLRGLFGGEVWVIGEIDPQLNKMFRFEAKKREIALKYAELDEKVQLNRG